MCLHFYVKLFNRNVIIIITHMLIHWNKLVYKQNSSSDSYPWDPWISKDLILGYPGIVSLSIQGSDPWPPENVWVQTAPNSIKSLHSDSYWLVMNTFDDKRHPITIWGAHTPWKVNIPFKRTSVCISAISVQATYYICGTDCGQSTGRNRVSKFLWPNYDKF